MSLLWRYYRSSCGLIALTTMFIIILIASCTAALTTFGKSNNNPPPTQAPIVKGRECQSHRDCDKFPGTSCVKDPDDYTMRCLCGDDTSPNNGLCPDVLKGLRHRCVGNNDCEEGMLCQMENTQHSNKSHQSGHFSQSSDANQFNHAKNPNHTNLYNQHYSNAYQAMKSPTSSSKVTICLCNNEEGYTEDTVHDICNRAVSNVVERSFAYIVAIQIAFSGKYLLATGNKFYTL